MEALTFTCSICGDGSHDICIFCTKDACGNHLCERCHRCSDCCECDMPRNKHEETSGLEPAVAAPAEAALVPNGSGKLGSG